MSISTYLYDKLIGTTAITGIVGDSIYPAVGDYDDIPYVTYEHISFVSQARIYRTEVKSIKSVETTQDLCETLQGVIYNTFDNTTSALRSNTSNINVEDITIVNSIPSMWNDTDRVWYGITDIQITYKGG